MISFFINNCLPEGYDTDKEGQDEDQEGDDEVIAELEEDDEPAAGGGNNVMQQFAEQGLFGAAAAAAATNPAAGGVTSRTTGRSKNYRMILPKALQPAGTCFREFISQVLSFHPQCLHIFD
jgi:hypothetical protein